MPSDNCLDGMKCRKCGNESQFLIVVTALAEVSDEGVEAYNDPEWNDKSTAWCRNCHEPTTVGKLKKKGKR